MGKPAKSQILVLLVAVGILWFAPPGGAQTVVPSPHRVASDQARSPIRVESNLVLVPTFVFYKDRISRIPAADWECRDAQWKVFLTLPASATFPHKSCFSRAEQVRGAAVIVDFQERRRSATRHGVAYDSRNHQRLTHNLCLRLSLW